MSASRVAPTFRSAREVIVIQAVQIERREPGPQADNWWTVSVIEGILIAHF
jgi:hypothetical protein